MDTDDRYYDLARRIGDGAEIDWDAELGRDPKQHALIERLRLVSELRRLHRDLDVVESKPADAMPAAIGPFRVRRRLGSGGLGVVYEAEQRRPRRMVALKVLRGARARDPDAVHLLEREARTLAKLDHPSISTIYEAGCTSDGQHFIAMELVRGQTLGDWRSARPTSADASDAELHLRVDLFRRITRAVEHAHDQGIIHRDLKPSNVHVLDRDDDGSEVPGVKILDFGLAWAAFLSGLTALGQIRGTLPYMSPEQARADPEAIDERTDVYSLGVILYELLADARPYDLGRGSLRKQIEVICSTPPRPLAEAWSRREPPAGLQSVVRKSLEKDPAVRYQCVSDLAAAVDGWRERESS